MWRLRSASDWRLCRFPKQKVCEKLLYGLHFPLIPALLLLYDLWSCYLITLQILSWFVSFRFLFLFLFLHYKSNMMKWSLKIKIVKNCRVCKIPVSYLYITPTYIFNFFGKYFCSLYFNSIFNLIIKLSLLPFLSLYF